MQSYAPPYSSLRMVYVFGSEKTLFWSCLVVSVVLMVVTMRFYDVTHFLGSSHQSAAPLSPIHKTVATVATEDSGDKAAAIPQDSTGSCPRTLVFARTTVFNRLGNHFLEYLSAWAVALRHKYTPLVSNHIYDVMRAVFQGLTVPSRNAFLRSLEPRCYEITKRLLRTEPSVNNSLIQKLVNRKLTVVLRPAIQLVDEIVAMRPKIKEELRFLPHLKLYAQRKLHELRKRFKAFRRTESETVYVGIHVRRKDYHQYLRHLFAMKNRDMANKQYYQRAMDFMLQSLPKSDVILVVVSDDKLWCVNALIPHLQRHLLSQNRSDHVTVVWGGSNNFKNDFSLLSFCNHSIMAYGTFGTSSSLLAGGRTVVYDVNRRNKMTGAMHFARDIPDWTAMK